MELPITVGEALRGAHIDVPTPGGTIKVKIPVAPKAASNCGSRAKAWLPMTSGSRRFVSSLMVRVPQDNVASDVIDKLDQAYRADVRQDIRL
jgi:curved DNA-binding protein